MRSPRQVSGFSFFYGFLPINHIRMSCGSLLLRLLLIKRSPQTPLHGIWALVIKSYGANLHTKLADNYSIIGNLPYKTVC